MSRYGELVTLALRLRYRDRLTDDDKAEIARVLAIPEHEAEIALRQCDEMVEEALRMNF